MRHLRKRDTGGTARARTRDPVLRPGRGARAAKLRALALWAQWPGEATLSGRDPAAPAALPEPAAHEDDVPAAANGGARPGSAHVHLDDQPLVPRRPRCERRTRRPH